MPATRLGTVRGIFCCFLGKSNFIKTISAAWVLDPGSVQPFSPAETTNIRF